MEFVVVGEGWALLWSAEVAEKSALKHEASVSRT